MNTSAEHENRVHTSPEKPFSFYGCKIPDLFSDVPLHWHSEYEISCIRDGQGIFRIDDAEYEAAAGDIILIQPNIVHSIRTPAGGYIIYDTIVFNRDLLGSAVQTRACSRYITPSSSGILRLNARISKTDKGYKDLHSCACSAAAHAANDSALDDIILKSRLLEFIYLMIFNGHYSGVSAESGASSLKPALEYIRSHLHESIDIRTLAQQCHLSESRFMSVFRRITGQTAIEYINRLRIREACYLLRTTDNDILDIAYSCGYRNLSNFNRHFRKIISLSPREYRQKDVKM